MNLTEIAKKTYSADPDHYVTVWMEIMADYQDHPALRSETLKNLQQAKEAGVSARALGAEMTKHINNSEARGAWSIEDIMLTNKAGKKVFGTPLIDLNKIELNDDDDDDDWDW